MSLIYKNPLTSNQVGTTESVLRTRVFGTNFSVLQVGGYMEVYTLADLDYTIPEGNVGLIGFSGNTIPINYSKRALAFLPDTLNLNSDNISSGRRRLGMLVYVHETKRTYQYTIDNYDELWDALGDSKTESEYGTTITTQTSAGIEFINAWLNSSIEGVNGVGRDEARWKIFYGTDITVRSGTYDNTTGTATFTNTTGGTFNVTGFTTGSTDTYITGGTYTKFTGSLQLTNNLGQTVNITGITDTNIANTDLALNENRIVRLNNNNLSFTGEFEETFQISSHNIILSASTLGSISAKGLTESQDNRVLVIDSNGKIFYNDNIQGDTAISAITYNSEWGVTKELTDGTSGTTQLPFITGGTYDGSNITLKISGNLEDDISISGIENTDTYLTAGSYDNSTGTLTLERNDAATIEITGFTTGTTEDTYVTGVTYNQLNKQLTLGLNDGVSFNTTGFAPTITGGTYSNGEISLENNDGTSTQIIGLDILTHIETIVVSSVSTSETTIDIVDTTNYEGAFFDYVINDGTNYRAGTVQSVWSDSTISYNDFSTVDIGNTSNFVWSVELSDGKALLRANILGGTWNIRIIKHII